MARLRGKSWQADVLVDGRRVRRLFPTREEALAFERSPYLSEKPTVGKVFRDGYEQMWRTSKDQRMAYLTTEELIRRIGDDKAPAEVTTQVVRQLVRDWRSEGLSDKTINRKLSKLSMLMKYAQGEDPSLNLPDTKRFKEGQGRLRFLTPKEATTIISKLRQEKHQRLARFLLYTGCRVSEALKLTWADVTDTTVTFWDTKNGKPRTIPLTANAKAALDVSSPKPWPVEYNTFHEDWSQARAKCGKTFADVVIHTLRHTCASWLVQGGVDLRRVKDWMGHADIKTTMLYAHLAPGDLQSAAHVLDSGPPADNSSSGVPNPVPNVPPVAEQIGAKLLKNNVGGVSRAAKGADCKSGDMTEISSP